MDSTIETEPEVYFVFYNESQKSTLFREAVKACQEAGTEPKQLSAHGCLQLTPSTKNDIFILDSFETEVYDHLKSQNARICGAPCVLHCLKNSEDLPRADHPVYSMCMSGAIVTLTGVPTTERAEIVKKIEWLGATYTKSLIRSTTHLIAQEVNSKKYQAAVDLKIAILSLDWLKDSYEKCKTVLLDAKDADFMKKYNCPIFLGCVITASNIGDRDKIREIVENGGGKYSGQMAYKECTHLIIDRPEGQKYKMAQKWGSIKILSPQWIYDCEREGFKLSEDLSKYSIRKASTPSKEEFRSPNLPDVSAIHSSTFSVTHIDDTMSTTATSVQSKASKRRSSLVHETAPAPKSSKLPSEDSTFADQSMLDTELLDGNRDDNGLLSQYTVGPEAKGEKTISNDNSTFTDQTGAAGEWMERMSHSVDTPVNKRVELQSLESPFEGISFTIDERVCSKEREAVSLMVRTHGGVLVDTATAGRHYNVLPLIISHRHDESTAHTTVSTVWVRACDRGCTLLPVDSNALFTPVLCTSSNILPGCVVTTTGLSAHERDAVSELMASAGGRYFEDLRKIPGPSVPATTHLICESTESAKYKAAKNWGINITSISWLTDSLKEGSSQPVESYHPLAVKAKKEIIEKRTMASLQTPVHSRVQALRFDLANTARKKGAGKQYLSTSILDDPERSFHGKLDLQCFDTPEPKPKEPQTKVETPLDQALEKYLQVANDKHYVKTPNNKSIETGLLAGTVICLSKKLSSQSSHTCDLITSLGGQFKSSHDNSVTHLIFQGKATEAEYRAAKRSNQFVVCPLWLEQCKEEKKKVAEALYPYNYKPERPLRGIENSPVIKIERLSKPVVDIDSTPRKSGQSGTGLSPPSPQEETGPETQTTMAETLLVYKQIKAYMNKRTSASKPPERPVVMNGIGSSSTGTTMANKPTEVYTDTQSQGDMLVTWDDTTSRCEQEMANGESMDSEVMAQMDDDFTQEKEPRPAESQDLSADYTTDNVEKMETSLQDDPSCKIFQLSGFSNEVRDEMAEKLRSLGAQTVITSNFDPTCTHIILNKPQRNEKYLCALVKGLWLLNQSYVQACVDSNTLVSEVKHEWGNPEATHSVSTAIAPFAEASYSRRLSVQNGKGGAAFAGWKVILALPKEKTDSMKRILELGEAHVLSCSGLPETVSVATHAFIDLKKSGVLQEDIKDLQSRGVKCLRAEYIPACLMASTPLDENKFTIGQCPTRSGSSSSRRSTRQSTS